MLELTDKCTQKLKIFNEKVCENDYFCIPWT